MEKTEIEKLVAEALEPLTKRIAELENKPKEQSEEEFKAWLNEAIANLQKSGRIN